MQFKLCIVFLFVCSVTTAQNSVCLSLIQPGDVHYGYTVKKILKRNKITRDSLTYRLHQNIIDGIKQKLPDVKLIIADDRFCRTIADSSEIEHMLTSSHKEAIVGKDGFERIHIRSEMNSTFYFGRVFTFGGEEKMKQLLIESAADYFILLSEFEGDSNFKLQFEVYDSNFRKVYGDKFIQSPEISKKMYFSAFLFHFDNFVAGFNEELVKQLKK